MEALWFSIGTIVIMFWCLWMIKDTKGDGGMKKHGFALVNKDQQYLYIEQVSSTHIEVWTSPLETDAHLFESEDESLKFANDIKEEKNVSENFVIWCHKEDFPYAIVEVTIVAHAEEVKRLIID